MNIYDAATWCPARCSATVLKDGKEGEYEKEGYGKRLYTNWKKVMFSTEGEVCHLITLCLLWDVFSIVCDVMSCLFLAVSAVSCGKDRGCDMGAGFRHCDEGHCLQH